MKAWTRQSAVPMRARSGSRDSWLAALLGTVALVSLLAACGPSQPMPDRGGGNPNTSTNAAADASAPARLIGRWMRPDGGYVVEIRSASDEGRLDAAYFNPMPINVARAEWRREGEALHVFLELRDVNYPGATYKLRYLPDKDRLAGEYFQPVYQQTFEVEFARLPRQ